MLCYVHIHIIFKCLKHELIIDIQRTACIYHSALLLYHIFLPFTRYFFYSFFYVNLINIIKIIRMIIIMQYNITIYFTNIKLFDFFKQFTNYYHIILNACMYICILYYIYFYYLFIIFNYLSCAWQLLRLWH